MRCHQHFAQASHRAAIRLGKSSIASMRPNNGSQPHMRAERQMRNTLDLEVHVEHSLARFDDRNAWNQYRRPTRHFDSPHFPRVQSDHAVSAVNTGERAEGVKAELATFATSPSSEAA